MAMIGGALGYPDFTADERHGHRDYQFPNVQRDGLEFDHAGLIFNGMAFSVIVGLFGSFFRPCAARLPAIEALKSL